MRYRLASTVPGMKRALSSEGHEVVAGWLFRLVSVGADVGVSIAAPQEPQKRFPSATSLAHDGQVATVPSSRRGRGQVSGPAPCAQSDMITRLLVLTETSGRDWHHTRRIGHPDGHRILRREFIDGGEATLN